MAIGVVDLRSLCGCGGAVVIPEVRASMTSAVILLLEPMVLFLLC